MTSWQLSPFLFFLRLNKGTQVVYNSLFLKKFFCDEKTASNIKSLSFDEDKPLFDYLQKHRFIVAKGTSQESEIECLIKREKSNLDKPKFKVFYVIVTTGCNFKCKYCYLSSLTDHVPRIMNLEMAKRVLSYFYLYIKKVKDEIPKLVLYGGEPLLNKTIIRYIIFEIKQKIIYNEIPLVNIILITNGSLLDEETATFLKEQEVLIALSLDGPRDVNNTNRVYPSGKGTYDDIVKAINLLNKQGIKPTISCTINDENVNRLEKIIPWMIKKFQIDSLGLNLFAGGDCSNKTIKQLSKTSAEQIIKVFKICRKYGIYEDTVIRQMKSFVEEKPNFYYCAATGRELAVDPEGNLAACPAFLNTSLFPFNIKQKKDLEKEEEFKKWAKRSPLLNKTCYSCIALGLCGGGCAFNSQKNYQNIYALDEFYCNYARGITRWMLQDLYKIVIRNHHGKYVPIPQIL